MSAPYVAAFVFFAVCALLAGLDLTPGDVK